MATVNTLKTRILNKYDLLANYSTFTPLKGEVCVAVIGEEATSNKGLKGDVTKKPIVGIKVGDGVNSFNDLPWIQAIAGDVSTFVKGIVDEAKFNELVNTLIANAKLATADALAAIDARLTTAEGDITRLSGIVETGDNSNANLRATLTQLAGVEADTYESNSIVGAKKYADKVATEKANAAQSAAEGTAKGYTDGEITKLKENEIKAHTDAIAAINTKIGEVAYEGDSLTDAIADLQAVVGGSDGTSLSSRVDALEGVVGDSTDGLVKDVADLQTAITDTGALGSRVKTLEGEMDVVQAATAGYNESKTIASDIQAAKDAAGAAQSKADTNEGTLTTLVGTNAADAGKSVRDIAGLVISEALVDGGESFDTLQEIAAWLKDHPEDVGEINAAIQSVKANLGYTTDEGGNEVVPATVDARIASAIAALEIATYAKQDDLDATNLRVKALEDANAEGGAVAEAIEDAKQAAIDTVVGTEGDAKTADTVYGAKAFATDAATTAKTEAIADAKTETENQIKALVDTGAVHANTEAIAAINAEIDAMDATFADTNAGVVTGLVQADGVITSVTQRKVKAADLDETDVFVFYCGNATGYSADMATVNIG